VFSLVTAGVYAVSVGAAVGGMPAPGVALATGASRTGENAAMEGSVAVGTVVGVTTTAVPVQAAADAATKTAIRAV
jgi:hypothetical protein